MSDRQAEIEVLSIDEQRVLARWVSGESMKAAYMAVMVSPFDRATLTDSAITRRAFRFSNTARMRAAMDAHRLERPTAKRGTNTPQKAGKPAKSTKNRARRSTINALLGLDFQRLCEALEIGDEVNALSVYGVGLYLARVALTQIEARRNEIEALGLDVLDPKNAPYTSQDLAALRVAASMILPFAPPPTNAERRAMALAGVIVGLTGQNVAECPDDYTAPPTAVA